MNTYLLIVFGVLGAIMGSFYYVVGSRMPAKKSIIKPRSHCQKCNTPLKFYELIPIISYLLQLGKCRHCHDKISPKYIVVELVTAVLFISCYNEFGLSIDLLINLIFISSLIIIIISDIEYMIILDEVLFTACIIIILINLFAFGFETALHQIIAGSLSFVTMYIAKKIGDFIFKKESLGGGDIKLMFLFGLVIGLEMSIMSIFIGTFIAFPFALYILFKRKDNVIAFGPFLSIAAILIVVTRTTIEKIISFIM